MLDQIEALRGLETTLHLMVDAVMVTEPDLEPPGPRIVFVNRAFTVLTGYSPDEIVGKTPRVLYGPNTDRGVFARLLDDLKTQRRFFGEAVVCAKDGAEFVFEWQTVPLLDDSGEVRYWLSIHRDTSRRRDAERRQRAVEQLYRHLVETQPDLICRFLPDTTLTFVNAAYATFFERKPEDLIGERFVRVLSSQESTQVLRHLASVTPDNPTARYEHRSVRAGGRILWHLWNHLGLFDRHGNLMYFQSVGTDITDRKKTEDLLRESENRIVAITDSLPSRISYIDKNEKYRFNNKAYERAFNVTKEYCYGKHVKEIIGERNYDAAKPYIEQALSGKNVRFEFVDTLRQGKTIEEISYVPDFDGEGEVRGFYVLVNDITDRKRVENELRRAKEFLDNVLDAIDDPVFVKDENHRWVVLNKRSCELIGGTRAELIGKSDFDYFSEEQASFHCDTDDEALKSQETIEFRENIRFGETIRTFSTKKSVFTDSTTGSRYIAGSTRDITELTQAQKALSDEKERAEVTLHSISDAVITTDAHGRIEYLNPVAEALTGWPMDEAIGRKLVSVFRTIDEQTRDASPDPVARCLAEGQTIGPENHSILISRSGREHAVEESAAPLRAHGGAVPGVVLVFRDVTHTRRMARQLVHEATHDSLTELVNRREFERRLERALGGAKRHNSRHALCYIDLDQFKIVNDTAGHAAGDQLLRQVRSLLAGKFRERDTLARLGGDEFALLLDNCGLDEAIGIAEIIISTFKNYRFEWQGQKFQVGASVGLVPVTAETESIVELLAQADIACYAAKERGRSRVHVYSGDGSEPSRPRSQIHLAVNIRDAIEQERFRLYYQPIVPISATNDTPVRYEVLLRLLDTDGSVLTPRAFIPAAERYGLMAEVDRWVIRTALRSYAETFANRPGTGIAINLSGNSLNDESLLEYVRAQFEASAVAAELVCFEITETAAIDNLGHAVDFITGIKKNGSRVAIDDFGSGLSSFKYLKTLPTDFLKIDGSFVRDMLENPVDHALVEAINEVGHIMGIQTIAEYVHSPAIMDRLAVIGVDCAQGFAIGEPSPLR